jgi:two-component system sensor histidine kinase/response regulator
MVLDSDITGYWEWNLPQERVYYSPSCCRMLGYGPNELEESPETYRRLIHPGDHAEAERLMQKHLSSNGSPSFHKESRFRHKNGSWIWILCSGRVVERDERGNPLRMVGSHIDITRSHKAEEEEQRLLDLLERSNAAARIGHWEVDPGTGDVTWSRVTRELHEVEQDQPLRVADGLLFYLPEDRETIRSHVENAIQQGIPFEMETRIVTAKGNVRWVKVWGIPQMEAGTCKRLYGLCQDIDDRMRKEKALASSESVLRDIVESTLSGFWDWNLKDNTEYLSPAFKRMFGYEDPEMENSPEAWQRIAFPEDLPAVLESFDRHVKSRGQEPFYNQVRYRHKDGSTVYVICAGKVIEWAEDGTPIRMAGCHIDITEVKKTQDRLRQSEERFRSLFQQSPVNHLVHDVETGEILDANPSALRSFGIEDLNQMDFSSLVLEEAPFTFQEALAHIRAAAENGTEHFEWKYRNKHGELAWEMVTLQRIELDGKMRVFSSSVDITRQKEQAFYLDAVRRRAEAQLRFPAMLEQLGEKEFMQHAQEVAEDLTGSEVAFIHFVNEAEGTIELVTWSSRTLQHYCKAAYDSHYPIDKAGIWAEALRERKPVTVNDYAAYPAKRGLPEGHAALKRFISLPVFEDGKVVMLAGVGNKPEDYNDFDVETVQTFANEIWTLVQRKRGQQELRSSEERLRALSEQVPGMVFQFQMKPDGRTFFPYASEHIRDMFGITPADVQQDGTPIFIGIHPEDISKLHASIAESFHHLSLWENESRYLHPTKGQIWHWGVASPAKQADGSVLWHGYIADVTERKNAEETLRLTNERLGFATEEARELAKAAQAANEAKSAFLANMSHEIRTPMNGILGMTELLKETPLNEEQNDYISVAHNSATSLLVLLDDLLDLSKIEAGRFNLIPNAFSLSSFFKLLCQPYRYQAERKNLGFESVLEAPPSVFLIGDEFRIRQIFNNLLNNAIKFTEAGRVRIRLHLEVTDAGHGLLCGEIQDTGIGIPLDQRVRIFEKFQQVDDSLRRRHGGSGLGLHICMQLTEMMGGTLVLDNEAHPGSLFRVSIPVALASSENTPAPKTAVVRPAAPQRELRNLFADQRIRILLVEDNPINQDVAKAIFLKLGIPITICSDAESAITQLLNAEWDLVFTDLQMPGMDGFDLLAQIRNPATGIRNPAVPVIALTAHAMHGDPERCREAGMDDFIAKPVSPSAIARVVSRWFPPGEPLPPAPPPAPAPVCRNDSSCLDFQGLCLRVMGDESLARTLLQHFLNDVPQQLTAMEKAFREKNLDAARRVNHTLKGASANINATEIHERATELQALLREQLPPDPASVLNGFQDALRRLHDCVGKRAESP